MKKIVFLLLASVFSLPIMAQDLDPEIYGAPRKNAIYGELGGSTYGLGLTYERRLFADSVVQLNARVGVGTLIFINALPTLGLNANFGKKSNFFELGLNFSRVYTIGIMGGDARYYVGQLVLGYRYQNPKGFLFRIGVSTNFLLYDPEDWIYSDNSVLPLPGVSLGYRF